MYVCQGMLIIDARGTQTASPRRSWECMLSRSTFCKIVYIAKSLFAFGNIFKKENKWGIIWMLSDACSSVSCGCKKAKKKKKLC